MATRLDLAGYKLTFDDEFDRLSLDPLGTGAGTWSTHFTAWHSRSLAANGEQQFYIDPLYKTLGVTPFSVADGVLTIEARPAPPGLRPQIDGHPYISGMISTENSFSQTYGYFEMRAQMPAGKGLWPAFWLLPKSGACPPELDILEVLEDKPAVLYQSAHGATETVTSYTLPGADSAAAWHSYGLMWNRDTIAWYVDGVQTKSIANYVNEPMYLILNLAVGGKWPGNPDAGTRFPARMSIDYVRVYQVPSHAAAGGNDHVAAGGNDHVAAGGTNHAAAGGGNQMQSACLHAADPPAAMAAAMDAPSPGLLLLGLLCGGLGR